MKYYPTCPHRQFLYVVFISLLLVFSCSKDSDLLNDAIFNEAAQSVEDRQAQNEESVEEAESEDIVVEEIESEEVVEVEEEPSLESRTTTFLPVHDAYLQNGDGVNHEVIRLQGDKRTSYLLYDLSPIDSVGGTINEINFAFTIYQDPGDGEIKIHKGTATDWTEENIDDITAPKPGIELGSVEKIYEVGKTESVVLDATEILPENTTLVLIHSKGDDLAIASKEHPTEEAPKLLVTYETPVGAKAIEEYMNEGIDEQVSQEEGPEEGSQTPGNEEANSGTNEPPVANISAEPSEGNAPLEVIFKASGSSDDVAIEGYYWDFDDGTTTDKKHPTHTFEKEGVYEVVLTATDEEGLTGTKTVTITVHESTNTAPVAKATASKTSGEAPLEIDFKASQSSDDVAIESYSWDFKDGNTSNKKNPTHIFTEAGIYEVELTVSDEEDLTDTTTITIEVEVASNQPPVAVAKANVESGDAPLEVDFVGKHSTDDKEIVSYSWNFGDYGIVSQKNPTQVFDNQGTYEVVLTVEDADGLSHSDTITITVNEAPVDEIPSTSEEVRYWQNKFDSQWSSDRSHAYSLANSKNKNQEYYYLSYYIDGLSTIWQATGDNDYLETALDIIDITIDDAQSVGGGYLGWRSAKGFELALWDSFYWRQVATILRIIYQSPSVRSQYSSKYNQILAFTEKHIWERYEEDSLTNFYRSQTHMSSHWARIGMELYIITGKSKYKEVFENISHGTMIGFPSNLRNQIYPNPKNSSAYAWDKKWGVRGGSSNIQDTSHAGPIVSFWVLAYENGMYWNGNDMNALIKTIDIVWPKSDPENIRMNVDGTGGTTAGGRLHEWLYLARYDQKLQNRIKNDYNKRHLYYYGSQIMGIAALNARILSSGRAVYPSN